MSARASIAVGRNQKAKPSSRRGRRGGITEQEVKDVEELATPRTPVASASGFLMAAMVWLLPGAERTQLHVIALVTWLIAVGGFTHIVAGSMEAYLLVLAGDWAWWQMLSQFLLPVLIGNMIGGTALFALLSYAQVMEEIEDQLT